MGPDQTSRSAGGTLVAGASGFGLVSNIEPL